MADEDVLCSRVKNTKIGLLINGGCSNANSLCWMEWREGCVEGVGGD